MRPRRWSVRCGNPLRRSSSPAGLETFDALVTGASEKGTWVRLLKPPAEGMLVRGQAGVKVGDQIKVQLASLNIERGFIDFVRIGK